MPNTDKSGVEKIWDAIAKHFEDTRTWYQLNQQQQQIFLQAINMMLAVVHKQV